MPPIVPGARVVGLDHPMVLGRLGVAPKGVLSLDDVIEEVFASKAVGHPIGDVCARR